MGVAWSGNVTSNQRAVAEELLKILPGDIRSRRRTVRIRMQGRVRGSRDGIR